MIKQIEARVAAVLAAACPELLPEITLDMVNVLDCCGWATICPLAYLSNELLYDMLERQLITIVGENVEMTHRGAWVLGNTLWADKSFLRLAEARKGAFAASFNQVTELKQLYQK